MGVNAWWLVNSFFKPQYALFSLACWASWNGMKEGSRDKEMNEAIKTQLYYYGSLQLSREGGRPPQAIKSLLSLLRSKFFFFFEFLVGTRKLFFFWACQRFPRRLLFLMYLLYFVFFLSGFILSFHCYHFYLFFNPHTYHTIDWLIDWLSLRVILYLEVQESCSLYVHSYFFV